MNYHLLKMLRLLCLAGLFFPTIRIQAQNQLKTYQQPIAANVTVDPPVAPVMGTDHKPINYNIGQNPDYTVRVKKANTNDWLDLFEYNTFVNSSTGDLSASSPSSFVTFDFSGSVTIEITSNRHSPQTDLNNHVKIRPLSKNITPTIVNNKITFTINNPGKFSVEVDGLRYHNLMIFANAMTNYTVPTTATVTYGPGIHIYDKALNNVAGKKIKILEGAIVIVPYEVLSYYTSDNAKIVAKTGDEIYIEGGGTLKGGIIAEDVNNVKIYGHGIIDLSNYEKQYEYPLLPNYAYTQGITIRRCNTVSIDGITIIDSQQICVELTDSNYININNVKVISRARWGDGFHMKGTSNVTINDCYNRTSDDSISIYASRRVPWDGNPPYQNNHALNITVTNTILNADKAHPITIGWHGNDSLVNNLDIYNIRFENIDILEHDENWVDPDGTVHLDYVGAISINCADGNNCSNFLFKDIRVEDFSNGRLLTIHVEPGGNGAANTDGKKVEYIRFENLSYNGSGELPSSIKGLSCDRYVNGVHFENFKVNGNLITQLSDYNVIGTPMFQTNEYAYNITFQEGGNYSTSVANGYYKIRGLLNLRYMQVDSQQQGYVTSTTLNSNSDEQIWQIELIPGTGHYRIKNMANLKFLENAFDARPSLLCQSRYLITAAQAAQTNQEWKIVPDPVLGYRINNAYTRSYLATSNDPNNFVLANPKNPTNTSQRWSLIPVLHSKPKNSDQLVLNSDEDFVIFPNPVTDFIQIQLGNRSVESIAITDMTGRVIIRKQIRENEPIDVSALQKGNYILTITDTSGSTLNKKIIKN